MVKFTCWWWWLLVRRLPASASWPVHMVNGAICLILRRFSLFFFFHHWNSQDLRKLDYMAKNSAFSDQINDEPFVTLFFFLVPSKMQNAFFSFGPAHSICKVSLEFLPTTLKDLWHKISSNGGFNFAKKKEIISSFVQRSFSGNNFWTRTVFFSFLSWIPFFSNKTQNTTTLIKVHGFI